MKGRKPLAYRLSKADRQYFQAILTDGRVVQRVGYRAQALLALDRGERIPEIVHWLGWSRMGLWYLWQRYRQYGVDAIFDAERRGRPPVFSPAAARPHRARRLHRPGGLWLAPGAMGLPQSRAGGDGTGDRRLDSLYDHCAHLGGR